MKLNGHNLLINVIDEALPIVDALRQIANVDEVEGV